MQKYVYSVQQKSEYPISRMMRICLNCCHVPQEAIHSIRMILARQQLLKGLGSVWCLFLEPASQSREKSLDLDKGDMYKVDSEVRGLKLSVDLLQEIVASISIDYFKDAESVPPVMEIPRRVKYRHDLWRVAP